MEVRILLEVRQMTCCAPAVHSESNQTSLWKERGSQHIYIYIYIYIYIGDPSVSILAQGTVLPNVWFKSYQGVGRLCFRTLVGVHHESGLCGLRVD